MQSTLYKLDILGDKVCELWTTANASIRPRSDRAIAIAIEAACGSVANAKTIAIIASTADRSYRYRCRYLQYRQFLGYDTKLIVWRRLQTKTIASVANAIGRQGRQGR